MSKVSVIIPVKPPEPYLETLIEKIEAQPYDKEILVQSEKGLSNAIRCGIERANSPIIAVLDADGSHNPDELPRMLELTKKHDLVIGSRYIEGGSEQLGIIRQVISKLYCWTARNLLGLKTRDPMSGYVMGKKELFRKIECAKKTYKFTVELLIHAETPIEHPIKLDERAKGKSKANIAQGLITLVYLANLWGTKHPQLYHFIKFSLVAFAFGYLGNLLVVYALEHYLGIWWGHGMLIGAILIHIAKFLFNEHWTWAK